MDVLLFPPMKKKQLDCECEEAIQQETLALAQREEQIKKDCVKKNLRALTTRFWVIFAVAFAIGGITAALIVFLFRYKINNPKNPEQGRFKAADIIAEERKKVEDKIQDITRDFDNRLAEYVDAFEAEAQSMSVNYAESPIAVEVINWISNGFCKTIDSADRRSHVEEIHVPFIFKVYSNKIDCQLGTYDFEIERCAELTSPLEQTALARAIAAAIQVNITVQYPQDPSGTDILTNIYYAYGDDNVVVTIDYKAPNGNYEEARSWSTD